MEDAKGNDDNNNQSDKTVREWHREAGNVPNYAQLQDAVLHIPLGSLPMGSLVKQRER